MGYLSLILFSSLYFLLFTKINCQTGLQCYVCNSNFRKCGDTNNFDPTIQTLSYCYGSCLKIVVKPGDFIIRTCSTIFENSFLLQNLTANNNNNLALNQCYLGVYKDPSTSASTESYFCFCNDKTGCNRSSTSNKHSLSSILFFIFVNILVFKRI